MRSFNEDKLADNVNRLKMKILNIAKEAKRKPDEIRIVPATKYVDVNVCKALIDLGFAELGENRIQELERKALALPEFKGWHFFGHLQKNKVRKALKYCKVIETIDNVGLVERIAYIANDDKIENVELFVEIKTSAEETKTGASINVIPELIQTIQKHSNVKFSGLMTMAALGEPEHSRKYFRELRELRDKIQNEFGILIPELSMGMSQDFEYAIKEGATIIRLGSVLYDGIFTE